MAEFEPVAGYARSRPMPELTARVDEAIRELRSCPPAEGYDRVRIPGEPESDRGRQQTGVPMAEETLEGLGPVGRESRLDLASAMKE